jgi:hypothetical protein
VLAAFALILLVVDVTAHVELSANELLQYHQNLKRDADALTQCLQSPEMREHNVRMLVRRKETLRKIRQDRDISVDSSKLHSNLLTTTLLTDHRHRKARYQ